MSNRSEQPRVAVRTKAGKHYISTEDFYNHPSFVRDKLLPKYERLHVTRFGKVVFVASEPDFSDLGITFEEY